MNLRRVDRLKVTTVMAVVGGGRQQLTGHFVNYLLVSRAARKSNLFFQLKSGGEKIKEMEGGDIG